MLYMKELNSLQTHITMECLSLQEQFWASMKKRPSEDERNNKKIEVSNMTIAKK